MQDIIKERKNFELGLDFLLLPRWSKKCIAIFFDSLLVIFVVFLSYFLRFGFFDVPDKDHWLFTAALLTSCPVFFFTKLYDTVIRYGGFQNLKSIIESVTLGTLCLVAISYIMGSNIPRSIFVIYWLLLIFFLFFIRALARLYFLQSERGFDRRKAVVIYGAGAAGRQLAAALRHSPEYYPVAFVDDKKSLWKMSVQGLKVCPPSSLGRLLFRLKVKNVFLALPKEAKARRHEIILLLEKFRVHVRTIPGLNDLVEGTAAISEFSEVSVEDILGRDPVPPVETLLKKCIKDKNVLITGGGGSIGSELCRQIMRLDPRVLVILDISEHNLYKIDHELRVIKQKLSKNFSIIPVLGSVCDPLRLTKLLKKYSIHTLYHAAAYKHVPLVESNSLEGTKNNIEGTYLTAKASYDLGLENFVLISTDKAVRPTNVMGASKRFSELILQAFAQKSSSTIFSMVRFGNVINSSGSVVPLFREQIRKKEAITLTHKDITRYFMTIPEAAELVLQASSLAKGGDVFVLDMGESVKIADLARRMIHLMGRTIRSAKNLDGDIEIKITGLRPGEKLYEELLIGEKSFGTEHPKILKAEEISHSFETIEKAMVVLRQAWQEYDAQMLKNTLQELVAGYTPQGNQLDILSLNSDEKKHSYTELNVKQKGSLSQGTIVH